MADQELGRLLQENGLLKLREHLRQQAEREEREKRRLREENEELRRRLGLVPWRK